MPWQCIFDGMSNKIELKIPQTMYIQRELGWSRKSTYMGHSFLALTYLVAFQCISLVPTYLRGKLGKKSLNWERIKNPPSLSESFLLSEDSCRGFLWDSQLHIWIARKLSKTHPKFAVSCKNLVAPNLKTDHAIFFFLSFLPSSGTPKKREWSNQRHQYSRAGCLSQYFWTLLTVGSEGHGKPSFDCTLCFWVISHQRNHFTSPSFSHTAGVCLAYLGLWIRKLRGRTPEQITGLLEKSL